MSGKKYGSMTTKQAQQSCGHKKGGGLDALIVTGYLTTTGKQAVLDGWPRARP